MRKLVKLAKNKARKQAKKNEKRSILEMSAGEAKKFLLKPESFCALDLPTYFDFSGILKTTARLITDKGRGDYADGNVRELTDVSYSLFSNKDGRYAWRPFQVLNPVVYVEIVNRMTEPSAWDVVLDRFQKFQAFPVIKCLSMPVNSSKRKNKGAQILQWWEGFEQKTYEMSLDFTFMSQTDIADCYGSIYTHTIPWALHGKKESKDKHKRHDNTLIGNAIDGFIQDLRNGQTNGIPQGSVLMDFIAEMVLGYGDFLLHDEIKNAKIKDTDYQILRYRDDYRIFFNDTTTGETILKLLTETLLELNLKLGSAKTSTAMPIVQNAIKPDKLDWLLTAQTTENMQKRLAVIHSHSLRHANSGSLVKALQEISQSLASKRKVLNPVPLIAIVADIACASPKVFSICASIISVLLTGVSGDDKKKALASKLHRKLLRFPNAGLQEIWLQRLMLPHKMAVPFEERLCRLASGESTTLWNSSWLKLKQLKDKLNKCEIIDAVKLKKLPPRIGMDETNPFSYTE